MLTDVIANITGITQRLKQQKSLQPNSTVNSLFTDLVASVQRHDAMHYQDIIHQYDLHCLAEDTQCLCSAGEYALELYWSEKIIHAKHPRAALEQFPYFDNYQQLVALESQTIKSVVQPEKILFIGSGPLPLTAILLAQNYSWYIDCMDRDTSAYNYGTAVSQALAVPNLNFTCVDVHRYQDLAQYQVIVLGALVGVTSHEKEKILNHIYSQVQAGTRVLVRSSHGLRELLYPSIDTSRLQDWHIEKIIHPKNDLINSLIVLCKP
jgi:nicotianamine synthase